MVRRGTVYVRVERLESAPSVEAEIGKAWATTSKKLTPDFVSVDPGEDKSILTVQGRGVLHRLLVWISGNVTLTGWDIYVDGDWIWGYGTSSTCDWYANDTKLFYVLQYDTSADVAIFEIRIPLRWKKSLEFKVHLDSSATSSTNVYVHAIYDAYEE